MARGNNVSYAAIGPNIDNGFEMGGSRIYPFSTGLAIRPTAMYSDYIGSGQGLPVSPPVGSLSTTIGTAGASTDAAVVQATAHPWGRTSPLPWVVIGLVGAVAAMHVLHYGGE